MNKAINSIAIKYKYMKDILQERFFQLLLECSHRKVSVTDRLKSYRVRFEQEKNALLAFN